MKTRMTTLPRALPVLLFCFAAYGLEAPRVEAATVTVRVAVFYDTEKSPLPQKAEIWIRGLGSWWIAKENVRNVPGREVGATDTIFVYPDGRSGKELSVPFKMTDEMCSQGCARDLISVDISDTHVVIHGTPIKAANGEFEVKLKRE